MERAGGERAAYSSLPRLRGRDGEGGLIDESLEPRCPLPTATRSTSPASGRGEAGYRTSALERVGSARQAPALRPASAQ